MPDSIIPLSDRSSKLSGLITEGIYLIQWLLAEEFFPGTHHTVWEISAET
jgi:hypothetical protein